MSASVLSTEDFEAVLTFQNRVHPERENYQADVIRLFKELFGWNLTAYSRWTKNLDFYTLLTGTLDEDFMHECHDLLIRDKVYQTYTEHISSNAWDGVFFSQDAIPQDKEDSDLLNYLRAHNVYYFVTMQVCQEPKEHYVFYKTSKEGPFTEREKAILRFLQRSLSSCANIYNTLSREANAIRVVQRQMDQEGKGLLILDESRNVLSHNESIFRIAPKGRELTKISAVARHFLQLLEEKTGVRFEDWHGKIQAETGSYLITAEEIPIQSFARSMSSFYLLTVIPAYYSDLQLHHALCKDYQLTDREAQIAELIIKGLPNKAIADNLYLSLSTVKVHVSHIYHKLQVHNRLGVVEKLMK